MTRQLISSGGPWEAVVGYSRAVRIGPHIWVAGSTAMTADGMVGVGDPYAQTAQTFRTIAAALQQAGASLDDVVRTRMFVIDIAAHQEAIGRAHKEAVGHAMPAATMVQVSALAHPDMLVEVEVEAFVEDR